MKRSLCLISLVFLAEPLSYAGNESHGGHAVVCQQPDGTKTIAVLDYYEAAQLAQNPLDLGGPKLSYQEKIKYVLDRLAKIDPATADRYRDRAASFERDAAFLDQEQLERIGDANEAFKPQPNCMKMQFAIQRFPHMPLQKKYMVSRDLWNAANGETKAGIVLHEVIYWDSVEAFGQETSDATRYYNGIIAGRNADQLTWEQYRSVLLFAGFQRKDFQYWPMFSYRFPNYVADYYPDLAGSPYVYAKSVRVNGRDIPVAIGTTQINLYDARWTINNESLSTWRQSERPGILFEPRDIAIVSFGSDHVTCRSDQASMWVDAYENEGGCSFVGESVVHLGSFVLNVKEAIGQVDWDKGKFTRLLWIDATTKQIQNSQGTFNVIPGQAHRCNDTDFVVESDGTFTCISNVESGTFTVSGQKVELASHHGRSQAVTFYLNGSVHYAWIEGGITLPTADGKTVVLNKKGSYDVEFDEQGKLKAWARRPSRMHKILKAIYCASFNDPYRCR